MRDGSTLTGMVTSTSASEITLAADDNKTYQIPMMQVKSIDYDDAQAAQNSSTEPGTTASQPSSGKASGLRERHHPTQAEIHTKTYVVPTDTKISVRADETINSATAAEGQTYAADVTDDVLDANGDGPCAGLAIGFGRGAEVPGEHDRPATNRQAGPGGE
jgi:hypothetical protein